ncbi:glycosyltransferase family 10 [bacterium]|nr:glycosyltransferase family 10 [bacterium]
MAVIYYMHPNPSRQLQDSLARRGVYLKCVDRNNIQCAEKIIFFDLDRTLLRQCLDAGMNPDRLVLFLYEPDAVFPYQYDERVWRHFGQIFTWRDDLVDNVRFFKYKWPLRRRIKSPLPDFHERKLVAMINANKYSFVHGEGYSYRRKAIRFFDTCGEFDLYGLGWNDSACLMNRGNFVTAVRSRKLITFIKNLLELRSYKSYLGPVADKDETLSHYRFCLCFENQLNRLGYITEKIFDCFVSGAIPVYMGATNVDEYIPRDCFIAMNEMKSFEYLLEYMQSMRYEQFRAFQQAGQEFIMSGAFHQWTHEGVYEDVADKLMCGRCAQIKSGA